MTTTTADTLLVFNKISIIFDRWILHRTQPFIHVTIDRRVLMSKSLVIIYDLHASHRGEERKVVNNYDRNEYRRSVVPSAPTF